MTFDVGRTAVNQKAAAMRPFVMGCREGSTGLNLLVCPGNANLSLSRCFLIAIDVKSSFANQAIKPASSDARHYIYGEYKRGHNN